MQPSNQSTFELVRQLREQGYAIGQITRITGMTDKMVRLAIRSVVRDNREVGEEQIIDGEPIAQRIQRLKSEIRAGLVVIKPHR